MIYDLKGCIFDMSKYGISHKKVSDCVGRPGHFDFLRNTSLYFEVGHISIQLLS